MPTEFYVEFEPQVPFTRPVGAADIHRLACYLLEDPGDEAHARNSKPFSVSPPMLAADVDELVGHRPDLVGLRLCRLDDDPDAEDRFRSRLEDRPNLGLEHPLRAVRLDITRRSFVELASSGPAEQCRVQFESPTHFSRSGRRYCLPDPMLVHRSLARRWNEFVGEESPLQLTDEVVSELCGEVLLTSCDVYTVGEPRPDGFLGSATFAVRPRRGRSLTEPFAALWRFARMAGVGALTTQGHGTVEIDLTTSSPHDA